MKSYHSLFSETVELFTVGIDIGSTTSHVVFSRLVMTPQRANLSSRYKVAAREILYQSPVFLTPYRSPTEIDVDVLLSLIGGAYREAGFSRTTIDSGVVIITGEAAKKQNARRIVSLFSQEAGRVVCAAAGPNLEARLSAYGSGAVRRSLGCSGVVLNIDIGGGTTKIARVRRGDVELTGSISVGARLIAFDEAFHITRLEQPTRMILDEMGLGSRRVGDAFPTPSIKPLAERLALALEDFLLYRRSALVERLLVTPYPEVPPLAGVEEVVIGGGVAEYLAGREKRRYGDLGPDLAEAVRGRFDALGTQLGISFTVGEEAIRSTVLGAGQFTVQVSGQSIYIGNRQMLPLRNVQVSPVSVDQEPVDEAPLVRVLEKLVNGTDSDMPLALSVRWGVQPTFWNLQAFARALTQVYRERNGCLVCLFDRDVARSMGLHLQKTGMGDRVICLDGLTLHEYDYVDIGQEMVPAGVVPVTVKSLVFRG